MNLDKVYTNELGLKAIKSAMDENINYYEFDEILDPCAGGGQLGTVIPVTHQYDIEPESENVIQKDFFKLTLDDKVSRLIVCSPPFGENFETGRRFLLKASKMSNAIASIVSKKVNCEYLLPNFTLKFKTEFKNKCFIKDGENIELNHYFCIWVKK